MKSLKELELNADESKRAETLSFFCIYITTQEGNQARDPRAWFFSYSVIFSAYWIYKRKTLGGFLGC